jgi:hypothetical protein
VAMSVIAKKRCRAMFEPPEKGERVTRNPNLSTRLNLLFSDQGRPCKCDCSNTITTTGAHLREGSVVSCGRWARERKRIQYPDQPRDK